MKFVLFLTDSYGMTPEDYLQPTSQRDYFCSTFGVFFFLFGVYSSHSDSLYGKEHQGYSPKIFVPIRKVIQVHNDIIFWKHYSLKFCNGVNES